MKRKSYDIKLLAGIEFQDYWNLREHPLYIRLEKRRPFFNFKERPSTDYEKIDSLQSLSNFLALNDWVFQSRYWTNISSEILAAINIPYSEL